MLSCNFLIRANDQIKLSWDILILIIAIFNSFSIPLTLAFDGIDEAFSNNIYYTITNLAGTCLFIFDILINLNTTYYDHDGEEVHEKKRIMKNYVFGLFPIDLMSSLPLEQISFVPAQWRILNMLKIIRVSRITPIINKMNINEETKSRLRMGRLVFLLLLCMHMVGCMWHLMCRQEELWIPPLDFVWAGLYPRIYRFYSKDDWYKYLVCLYNAVLFLGGNEMGPRTDAEIVVCTLILVIMAIFNAWLFGDMAVLTEMSGRK